MSNIPSRVDYPTAWRIMGQTDKARHHEKCSFAQVGMLCDCAAVGVIQITFDDLRSRLGAQVASDVIERAEEFLDRDDSWKVQADTFGAIARTMAAFATSETERLRSAHPQPTDDAVTHFENRARTRLATSGYSDDDIEELLVPVMGQFAADEFAGLRTVLATFAERLNGIIAQTGYHTNIVDDTTDFIGHHDALVDDLNLLADEIESALGDKS